MEDVPMTESTPGVAWLTVAMGGMLLCGNVAELGGVQLAAKEWTAWLLAGIVLVHGVSLSWRWGQQDEGLRLPRWPMLATVFVIWLGYVWWQDQTAPWNSRAIFVQAAEGWLLCWVVAVTPGTRAISWAWLMVVVAAAVLALMAAVGNQATQDGLWLPAGRRLPVEWMGRWSGTLPLPGAFGALMVLAGPPLLVLACARRMPVPWRILCGSGGFALLLGAIFSFSLGAWLAVIIALGLVPAIAARNKLTRVAGWWVGACLMVGWVYFLFRIKVPGGSWLAPLETGEPTFAATWQTITHTWKSNLWLGGNGTSFTELARNAGVPGSAGGWSYGFSDWSELAAVWGLLGLVFAALIIGGLLFAAWVSWARLPRFVSRETGEGEMETYTPEAKVLLGAILSGLTAFIVAMTATRSLQVPAIIYTFAIVAGVLSRNVPQRGGVLRLDSSVRSAVCLGAAALVAFGLIWKVALITGAREKLAEAKMLLAEENQRPDVELLVRARADLREVLAIDANNAPALTNLAWLELAQAQLEPAQTGFYVDQAEYNAVRASNLAPLAPEPWIVRSLACWLVNRPKDAGCYMNYAVELAPRNPMVQYYAAALFIHEARQRELPLGMRRLPLRYTAPATWPPLAGLMAEPGSLDRP